MAETFESARAPEPVARFRTRNAWAISSFSPESTPHALACEQIHRFDVPVASTFGGKSHEALERHLLVGNDRVTDQRFVGARFLTARLATQPLLNESRAQRAVRRVRQPKPNASCGRYRSR